MSTNYTDDSSRRPSSSRGGRRPRRRSDNESKSGSYTSGAISTPRPPRKEPKKLSLWEKVIAFVTGKPTEAPARREAPVIRQSRPQTSGASADTAEKPKRERKPREPRTGIRKPESVEVTTPRVYVGNLSFDATESDLVELFNGVGIVQNAEIVSNRQTQRSKGFGFVQLQSVEEAQRAVAELHDKEYMGRKLVVSGAKAADRRDDRSSASSEADESQEPVDVDEAAESQPPEDTEQK